MASTLDILVGLPTTPNAATPSTAATTPSSPSRVRIVPYTADLDPDSSTFLPWLWRRLVDDKLVELYFPGRGTTGFADLVKLFSGEASVAVVIDVKEEKMVGYVSWTLLPLGTKLVAMAGFMFFREYWGHGLTDHAARAAFAYWFTETPIEIIVGACPSTHRLAMRYNERVGLRNTGFIPQAHVHNGSACDAVLFSITKDEWQAGRGR